MNPQEEFLGNVKAAVKLCIYCGRWMSERKFSPDKRRLKRDGTYRLRSDCQDCNIGLRNCVTDLKAKIVEPPEGTTCQVKDCERTDIGLDHIHIFTPGENPAVDKGTHTGIPRGWLCPAHNMSLGQIGDTKEGCYNLGDYCERGEQGLNIEWIKPNPAAEEFFVSEAP